jgi:hypothetical protein
MTQRQPPHTLQDLDATPISSPHSSTSSPHSGLLRTLLAADAAKAGAGAGAGKGQGGTDGRIGIGDGGGGGGDDDVGEVAGEGSGRGGTRQQWIGEGFLGEEALDSVEREREREKDVEVVTMGGVHGEGGVVLSNVLGAPQNEIEVQTNSQWRSAFTITQRGYILSYSN